MSRVSAFLHAFIPLFVAVDVVGIAPVYLTMSRGMRPADARAMLRLSLLVAAAVSVGFALLGKLLFEFLAVTAADFQVAGGLILLVLAGQDLVSAEPRGLAAGTDVGVVPLAVPLIAGPAVITSTIVLVDLYGPGMTVLALLANLGVCWLVLGNAPGVERVLGRTGARASSKIVSLLLAAIAVRLIRQGIHG